MLFNSWQFLVFFPTVVFVYFLLPHRVRWAWLLGTSCVFYMAFVPAYILILLFTITVDYIAGLLIESAQGTHRKWYLGMSIVANMGVLLLFKYFDFFIGNFDRLFHFLGLPVTMPLLHILLPLGLSFHTFQALSYTIEVYYGRQKAERHPGIYALYVMFFPQLVAGPIERPQNVLHQYHEKQYFKTEDAMAGFRLMLWGFFKKVVVADRLGLYVDPVFTNYHDYNGLNLVLAAIFFVFQIYCDFSGYSDIAIGAARVLGIRLMINFDRPLWSRNVTEFWRRWHISLSTWLRDYIFSPLTIKWREAGIYAVLAALMVTFVASGLWHGAGWNFVILGILYGLVLCYEAATKKQRKKWSKSVPPLLYASASVLLTFACVTLIQVFFRSPNATEAFRYIGNMTNASRSYRWLVGLGPRAFGIYSWAVVLVALTTMVVVEARTHPLLEEFRQSYWGNVAFCGAVLFAVLAFGIFDQTSFIYFQF